MIEWIRMHEIEIEIQSYTLLEKVTGAVNKGDVIGIIGKNGAGKSTLLNLLNNELAPAKGQLTYGQENLKVSMVEQETESYLIDRLTADELTLLKNWQVPEHDFEKLSGGEKLKARLAKGFTTHCDLLLLDEPTNHLDEQSLAFLTKQIKAYKGTIVLVSHDRAFLDNVVTKIWALENRSLIEHKGNYTSYMKAREEKRLAQQRDYEKQQKKIKRIENQMNQLSSWSSKAHAQSTKQEGFKEFYRVKAKKI
uniref:ATP-binding cassette domain-containing protein n=1 Tax=Bacillus sp. JCM 19041 TaxID=1460637 RepID=UPI000A8338A6